MGKADASASAAAPKSANTTSEDSLDTYVSDIALEFTELGCSLYPPHDPVEVNQHLDTLLASGQKLFASLLSSGVLDDEQKAGLQGRENKLVVLIADIQGKS